MTPFEIFRKPLQLRRFNAGFYLNGIWQQGSQIVMSGNLLTGNVVIMSLNGIGIPPIFYAGSNAATITLMQNALASQPNIQQVLVSTDFRTITVIPTTGNLAIVNSVTISGVGAPTASIANSPTVINITASYQPTTGEEMLSIPEDRRNKKVYSFFTSSLVRVIASGANPDQVVVNGSLYEVFRVEPWQNRTDVFGIINHYKFYASELEAIL